MPPHCVMRALRPLLQSGNNRGSDVTAMPHVTTGVETRSQTQCLQSHSSDTTCQAGSEWVVGAQGSIRLAESGQSGHGAAPGWQRVGGRGTGHHQAGSGRAVRVRGSAGLAVSGHSGARGSARLARAGGQGCSAGLATSQQSGHRAAPGWQRVGTQGVGQRRAGSEQVVRSAG